MSVNKQCKARWRVGLLRLGLLSAIVFALATTAGAGALIDGPFEIAVGAGDYTNPAIAYNWHQEQFLVAYDLGTGFFSQVLLTKHGTVAWDPPIAVLSFGEHPALAYNSAANQYLLVWQDYDSVSSLYKIWGIHLGSDGL